MRSEPHSKILSRHELTSLRESARAQGRTVVQCHGCFDIVHPGHIRHLRFARQQGDILLVSITADESIRKGTGRPLFTAELRAENLAALDCVDWVIINAEPTAEELLHVVRPDVYIKGREYESNDDPRFAAEREAVEHHGGRVVFSSGDIVFSSSALVRSLEADSIDHDEHPADPRLATLRQLYTSCDLSATTLASIVSAMGRKRVTVIGETIVDTYIYCDRPTIASEASCLSLRPIDRTHYDGGAAIIARHAAALGATPTLITALPGRDESAVLLRNRLAAEGIEVLAAHTNAPLPEKQRFIVANDKVMKVDLARDLALDAEAREQLVHTACDRVLGKSAADATIIADFGLGMLTPRTIARLCDQFRDRRGVLAGDVSGHRASLLSMKHADLLMPSEQELRAIIGDFESSLNATVGRLIDATSATGVCVTMGEDGATLFQRRETAFSGGDGWQTWLNADHVPALTTQRVDVLGCGDAMLATATLALAADATMVQATFLGAIAAAIHAERPGNQPVTASDLIRRIDAIGRAHLVVQSVAGKKPLLRSAS